MAERLRVEDDEFLSEDEALEQVLREAADTVDAEETYEVDVLVVSQGIGRMAVGEREAADSYVGVDSFGQYKSEAGATPLLTKAEEVNLARRMEHGKWASERAEFLRYKHRSQELSAGVREELSLLDWMIRDARAARQHLISANLRLVISIATKYHNPSLDALDLIQEGNIGLMRAADKFDYTLGYKFSTYATWWIRQAIQRAIVYKARLIRLPDNQADDVKRLGRLEMKLSGELNRQPTEEELVRETGFSAEQIQELRRINREPVSLETPVGAEGDTSLGELLEDKTMLSTAESVMTNLFQEQVRQALEASDLGERAKQVLRLRYGLEDGQQHTLDYIAKRLGLSHTAVGAIERKSLARLRRSDAMRSARSGLPS